MRILLLQIPEAVAQKALEVSPYNALAFGFLVFVLGAGCVYFARDAQKSRAGYKELATATLKLLATVEVRLTDQKDLNSEVLETRRDIEALREFIEQRFNQLNTRIDDRGNK